MSDNKERDAVSIVPSGMVRLAEYGQVSDDMTADYTDVAHAVGALHGFPMVRLYHSTRGYVIAGSMMRWDEARWHVTYTVHDGGIHGRAFLESDETAARAYFAKITDGQKVSAMRQSLAQREDEARDETAACAAVADTVTVEAAKTYRSGWQYRAEWPGLREWCGYAKTKKEALAQGRAAVMHRVYCQRHDSKAA